VEELPDVNDPVMLRDRAGRQYASRVEDLAAGLVVVAQPRDLPADEAFGAGTEVDVTWVDADGVVMALPTRILVQHARDRRPVWSLAVTGEASSEQRRRSERVPATGPATIRAAGEGEAGVAGHPVGGSEGGVRCSVVTGAADRFLTGPNEVVAEFRLGTVDFAVPGRVEFLRPTKRPTEVEDLVVVFDDPVPDADALRKAVFALELESLQNGDEETQP